MELTTRCPECDTAFTVSLEQLQLRKGYIRCIQCAHIFDGFDASIPADPHRPASHSGPSRPDVEHRLPRAADGASAPVPATPSEHEGRDPFTIPTRHRAPSGSVASARPEPQLPSVLRGRDEIRGPAAKGAGPTFTISEPRERTSPPGPAHSVARDDVIGVEPGMFVGEREPGPISEDLTENDYLFIEPREGRRSTASRPEFLPVTRRRSGWLTALWAVLTVCGIALLLVQGVYVYRAQLANAFPALRPSLVAACASISCSVPYDRRIDAITITGSALRSSAGPKDEVSRLTLEVTLRNTHRRPQEWPTLVLDLKDASGTIVVRRNLVPAAWVPSELRDGPFAPGQEITVHVPVSVRGLQANGYQLDKFFP